MCKFRHLFAAICAVLYMSLAQATPLVSFDLLPANGAQSGLAGTSVGWGYSITNRSNEYLVTTAINSDPFTHGSPLSLFDFPVIAPNSTVTETFITDDSGLFQLTWDADAPGDFVNAGLFELSASFFDNDPNAGGNFLVAAEDTFAPYSATVTVASSPPTPANLPLPPTLPLLLLGWATLASTHRFGRDK
ncbi:hypothetical protein H3H36_07235 [Duganella sp. FT3S]|uniref:PEP-CTERM sorting domain-containing protein n=1 Tax=Rugamonas fusca TaxID=2758568 RepID=A0A7W2EFT8_9BURK|nr:hypothetical protein [Rugamonas fusca]MBA5605153.1 hypothetical protein [Rugamonas fusca]